MKVVETWQPVGDGKPAYVSRWRKLTERYVAKANAQRILPSYRYEVMREGRHYVAVAFQNKAVAE